MSLLINSIMLVMYIKGKKVGDTLVVLHYLTHPTDHGCPVEQGLYELGAV